MGIRDQEEKKKATSEPTIERSVYVYVLEEKEKCLKYGTVKNA